MVAIRVAVNPTRFPTTPIWEIMNAESIIEKIPADRQPDLKASDIAVNDMLIGLVNEAIACGDLVLRPGDSPQEITFGLWAITDGGFAAILGNAPLEHLNLRDPYAAIFKNCHVLGDGYGWRPLSTEWDYDATVERIRREVFRKSPAWPSAAGSGLTGPGGRPRRRGVFRWPQCWFTPDRGGGITNKRVPQPG